MTSWFNASVPPEYTNAANNNNGDNNNNEDHTNRVPSEASIGFNSDSEIPDSYDSYETGQQIYGLLTNVQMAKQHTEKWALTILIASLFTFVCLVHCAENSVIFF